MARYQNPPDPRKRDSKRDQPGSYQANDQERNPIPWVWLVMGIVVTILGIGIAIFLIAAILNQKPLATSLPSPTFIRLTAAPSPIPTGINSSATATQIPTFTPPPTPDISIAPETVTIGYYAQVYNTDGVGVSLRGGPSTENVRLLLVPEESYVLVTGGPEEGDGLTWWQVVEEGNVEGWIAGDFLTPASSPVDDNE